MLGYVEDEREHGSEIYSIQDDGYKTQEESEDSEQAESTSLDDPDHPYWDIKLRIYETDDSWEYQSGLSDIPDPESDSDEYSDEDYPGI